MRGTIVKSLGVLGFGLLAAGTAPAQGHSGSVHGSGAHVSGAHVSGAHGGFAGGGRTSVGSAQAYAGPRGYSTAPRNYSAGNYSGYHGGYSGYHGSYYSGYHGGYSGYHGGYYPGYHGGYPGYYGGYHGGYHGFSTGVYWGGGWWHGGYWPRCSYGPGFVWFLPVLPLTYATYWYSGVPYYYANNVYYTWDPSYSGYVATDPPPAAQSGAAAPAADQPLAGNSAYPDAAPAGDIFMYPTNGQSPQQQAVDKRECAQWAAGQVGQGSNGPDYRRAMTACVEGRGYTTS